MSTRAQGEVEEGLFACLRVQRTPDVHICRQIVMEIVSPA
jgi:hypothetical protein